MQGYTLFIGKSPENEIATHDHLYKQYWYVRHKRSGLSRSKHG